MVINSIINLAIDKVVIRIGLFALVYNHKGE